MAVRAERKNTTAMKYRYGRHETKIYICLQCIGSWIQFLRRRSAYSRIEVNTTKSTAVKPSWHSYLRNSWVLVAVPAWGITVAEALKNACIFPASVWPSSRTLCRDFTVQVWARLIELKILLPRNEIKGKHRRWAKEVYHQVSVPVELTRPQRHLNQLLIDSFLCCWILMEFSSLASGS